MSIGTPAFLLGIEFLNPTEFKPKETDTFQLSGIEGFFFWSLSIVLWNATHAPSYPYCLFHCLAFDFIAFFWNTSAPAVLEGL